MRKYQSAKKIIAIWTINNFIAHKLLNPCARVILDTFCYYTTNNWKKLINQEDEKNTAPIATLILTTIRMYIGLTKFLEKKPLEIKCDADGVICKRCPKLDWRNNHKKEVAKKAINKDSNNETLKQKAKQIKKKKE